MNKKPTEKIVMRAIASVLSCYPEVVHFDRLNSGTISTGGRYIRLCRAGTPDFYALIRKNDTGHLLFIEAKRPGGKQTIDQLKFQAKIANLINVYYIVATSGSIVSRFITDLIY